MTRHWKLVIIGAAVVAGVVTAALLLPLAEWTIALATRARNTGAAGIAVFTLAYIVSTVALLPASLLTLAAGFAYGPVQGLLIVSPASVAAATVAFLLGRTSLRGWARRAIEKSPKARALDREVGAEGFKLVLLLRLSPVFPFALLNYALSLTQVPLRTYVVASFIGMLPGTALYVYLGSLATVAAEISSAGKGSAGGVRIGFYAVGLLATILVVVLATRAANRAIASPSSAS